MNTKSFVGITLFIIVLTMLVGTMIFGGNIFIVIIGSLATILLLVVAYAVYEEDSLDREEYKRRMDAYKELTDSISKL